MIQNLERFINKFKGEVWPDISSVAQYCTSPEDFLDLIDVLLEEIENGCLALGVYGSRKNGTNIPESDFDLFSVQPGRGFYINQPKGRKRLVKKSRYPENLFSTGHTKPWIEINRISLYDIQNLSQKSFTTQKIFHETTFLWFRNMGTRRVITTKQSLLD
jgi:hypothetical protein